MRKPQPSTTSTLENNEIGYSATGQIRETHLVVLEDPWAILGIDKTATLDEAKAAFRLRSQVLHPDRHDGAPPAVRAEATRAMQALNEAWAEILRRQGTERSQQRGKAGRCMSGGLLAQACCSTTPQDHQPGRGYRQSWPVAGGCEARASSPQARRHPHRSARPKPSCCGTGRPRHSVPRPLADRRMKPYTIVGDKL